MDILFNELSLEGQFHNQKDFIENGLPQLISILKRMQEFSLILLKKNDMWNYPATPSDTFYTILTQPSIKNADEVTRFKSALSGFLQDPFWDTDPKYDVQATYYLNETNIFGSSPAEACERDKIIVSIVSSSTSANPLKVTRNNIDINLENLTSPDKLIDYLRNNQKISFELYVKAKFSRKKLNFSKVDSKMGFSTIQSTDEPIFLAAFEKFERLTWDEIYSDTGLRYKEYKNCLASAYRGIKTYKFRASEKLRCHGYRQNDFFFIIGFEDDHKLSNLG